MAKRMGNTKLGLKRLEVLKNLPAMVNMKTVKDAINAAGLGPVHDSWYYKWCPKGRNRFAEKPTAPKVQLSEWKQPMSWALAQETKETNSLVSEVIKLKNRNALLRKMVDMLLAEV